MVFQRFTVLAWTTTLLPLVTSTEYLQVFEETSALPTSETATYDCEIRNLWTRDRHPARFPGRSAHWSPPVAASHDNSYVMFEEGITATRGVEIVAEVRQS